VSYRTFRTAAGVEWQVWNVVPGAWRRTITAGHERRSGDRRSPDPVLRYSGPERRRAERRKTHSVLGPELAGGWLIFKSGADRRRVTPIPPGWEKLSDTELERLCAAAFAVPPRAPR
jgi:hypothetical protein